MWRSAKFQSFFGLTLGIVSWMIPFGVAFALAAIIFGLVGLYRGIGRDTTAVLAAIGAILLGISSRLIFAFNYGRGTETALVIATITIIITAIIGKRVFLPH